MADVTFFVEEFVSFPLWVSGQDPEQVRDKLMLSPALRAELSLLSSDFNDRDLRPLTPLAKQRWYLSFDQRSYALYRRVCEELDGVVVEFKPRTSEFTPPDSPTSCS